MLLTGAPPAVVSGWHAPRRPPRRSARGTSTAPSRRTRAGSTRTMRSTRTSLGRPCRSQAPVPMSTHCAPVRGPPGRRPGRGPGSSACSPSSHGPSCPMTRTGRSLPAGVVLLEGHPGPDDLAGVGVSVVGGGVGDVGKALEVSGVTARGWCPRCRTGGCGTAVRVTGGRGPGPGVRARAVAARPALASQQLPGPVACRTADDARQLLSQTPSRHAGHGPTAGCRAGGWGRAIWNR